MADEKKDIPANTNNDSRNLSVNPDQADKPETPPPPPPSNRQKP